MENYYLKTITVPIPEDKLVVIRKGERVEYEIDRIYLPEEQNTRVKRKVIGKVDPVQPGRMFPNEFYFELFPDNEVPEEIREEFLRECEIKRQMKIIRRSPEEVVDHVVRGLGVLGGLSDRCGGGDPSTGLGMTPRGNSLLSGSLTCCGQDPSTRAQSALGRDDKKGDGMNYTMLRRVFDEIYYAIEELAGKFPNEKIEPFKMERINEVLEELRGAFRSPPCPPSGGISPDDGINKYLRLIEEGLTYSDVLLMLKWYKVLPR